MEIYSFENGLLKLVDPELQINYEEPFSPLLIPDHPKNNLKLDATHRLASYEFSDGSLENEIVANGIRNGQYTLTYPNGNIKLDCFYKDGKLHGSSTFYGEEHQILVKSWYLDGKLQGKSHSYYVSGSLCSVQRFQNGIWHGLQEFWYENGVIKTQMTYKQGELDGIVKLFYPTGALKRQLIFKEGQFVKE